ncbi:MAG: hypothetical protein RL266_2232 [Bacteroidota bacterium]
MGQYQLNGSASQISCNCYELTPDQSNVGGSVWNVNQINLNDPFDFHFDVWLGCDDWGADGIAFVLQPLNVNQGGISSSLGYGGVSPSIAIEIDTWPNDVTMSDPQPDHIAIMQNGTTNHASAGNLAGPVTASSSQNNIEDCAWHDVRIVWSPSLNSITVYFDGVFRTSYTGNIIANIFNNSPLVYWGWTGGTGGASSDQRFCNTIDPDFDVLSNTTCVGSPIQFDDVSITSSGNISNYSWNFDDGSTGSGAPVSHVFNTPGIFDVELTITSEGCTDVTTIPITIDPAPVVNLGADISLCGGETAQLNSPNTLGSGTYSWSPITALSNATAPSPTTSTANNITYTLTFTSNNGCSDSDDIVVTVSNGPTASAGPDATVCEGESVQLQGNGGQNYSWSPVAGLDNSLIANPTATPTATTTYTVTVTDVLNCSATDDVTITVVQAPTLNAGADQDICEGDVVQLSASGTGSFVWSPATALSSTSIANPTANPTNTVTYTVTLTDANNCTATDDVVVNVDPIPTANFSDPTPVCNGNMVQFTDNSSGTIASYLWDFGDGQFGQTQNPSHVYPDLGTYQVTLTVVSANGCTSSAVGTAEVVDGPLPDISIVNGPDLCVGELLEILDNSSGPIASYSWDFGNGSTSSDQAPTFQYASQGTYTITLTLTAIDGCANSQSIDVDVHPLPTAEFSNGAACVDQPIVFTEQSTVSAGSVVGWEWNFGDGTAIDYGSSVNHSYNSQTSHTVTMIAQTAVGCRDTVQHIVSINPTPVVSVSASTSCVNSDVSFINGTLPNDNTISQWVWDFGDGSSSNLADPTHAYADHGTYTFQLQAVSDSGCVGVGSNSVEIDPYPQSSFSFSGYEGCAPIAISFTDQSSITSNYSIGSYQWLFGDGSSSSESDPTHTYASSGNFDVSLITTTAGTACSDTLTLTGVMNIYLTPEASFYHSPESATMLDPRIYFINTSTDATNYVWDFGDENSSVLANPVNSYPAEGDYTVTLVATNGICTSSTSQRVHIDPETFVYIPNAFSPNGDGLNDTFIPQGIGIERFNMAIYDRWGKELYFTNSIDEPWRGWYNGLELPNDSYVYRIEILDVKEEIKTYCGSVNLVR